MYIYVHSISILHLKLKLCDCGLCLTFLYLFSFLSFSIGFIKAKLEICHTLPEVSPNMRKLCLVWLFLY